MSRIKAPPQINSPQTIFFDKDGDATRLLITGVLKVQLTNTSTGKSMDLNISGPGNAILNEDGTETWFSGGTWLISLFPTDVPDFQPRMFLLSGRMVMEIDPEVGITDIEIIGGRFIDICAALSG